jgi:Ca-activated chloride channel family protein
MTFENAAVLWSLVAIPPVLLVLGFWGWHSKKEAMSLFPSAIRRQRFKQIEKYLTAGVLLALMIVALATPQISYYASAQVEKSGEIILLVDTTRSMAAQADMDSPNRIERVKGILLDIIEDLQDLGQVKFSLCGFNDITRSHVPMVGTEDYPYLKASINMLLDANSTPGSDTGFGLPIIQAIAKFSEGDHPKQIVILSDGEAFFWGTARVLESERENIEEAVSLAISQDINVYTVGVGEAEGARVPLFDDDGEFTGRYAPGGNNPDYIFYLHEELLQEIADRTGGEYYYEEDLSGLTDLLESNLDTVPMQQEDKEIKKYHSVAHWFLLAALPVWVILVRRHLLG